jgi:hypothetical protein
MSRILSPKGSVCGVPELRKCLLLTGLLITGCSPQQRLDRDAFETAATKCHIHDRYFEPSQKEEKSALEGSTSPFRWFGDWWLERQRKRQGITRHYLVHVPAVYGGYTPLFGQKLMQRQRANREVDCLSGTLAPYGIAVRSTMAVIVE